MKKVVTITELITQSGNADTRLRDLHALAILTHDYVVKHKYRLDHKAEKMVKKMTFSLGISIFSLGSLASDRIKETLALFAEVLEKNETLVIRRPRRFSKK